MSWRWGCWLAGLPLVVAAAAVAPEESFPAARPAVFGLGLVIVWGVADVAHWVRFVRGVAPAAPTGPRDTRPADGVVGVAALPGARREANRDDPRFGRFLGWETTAPGHRARAHAAARTSPPLLGRVVLCSLYLGRDRRDWNDAEVARSHEALTRAAGWVERQAQRYGAAVNLDVADTYFLDRDDEPDEVAVGFAAEGEETGPLEENAVRKALVALTRSAVRLGFGDAADLFGQVEARLGADAVVWLVHERRRGRSFAVPREDSDLPGVSLAVCYVEEESFPERLTGPAGTDPITVAHELMHLFGATDKYGRPLSSFDPRAVTEREVMRDGQSRLSRLRVDPHTAREIGWPDTPAHDPEPPAASKKTTAVHRKGRPRSSR